MRHIWCLVCSILFTFCQTAVIPNAFLPAVKQTTNAGLYGVDDKVVPVTSLTINETIYNRNHATELEFYNSFCGFCKRFAPIYKEYAKELYTWRDVVLIAAIDCAADENADLCRQFEIMSYPTIRYFSPYYIKGEKQYGVNVDHEPMDVGHASLIALMRNETSPPSNWPNLKPIQFQTKDKLFTDEPNEVDYMFLLYDLSNKSTIAQDVTLDFHKTKIVSVRQVASVAVSVGIGLPVEPGLHLVTRDKLTIESIPAIALNRTSIAESVKSYLVARGVDVSSSEIVDTVSRASVSTESINIIDEVERLQDLAIIEQVKGQPDVVFQADLEGAIRYSLFHELAQFNELSGERFGALQRYLIVLAR